MKTRLTDPALLIVLQNHINFIEIHYYNYFDYLIKYSYYFQAIIIIIIITIAITNIIQKDLIVKDCFEKT